MKKKFYPNVFLVPILKGFPKPALRKKQIFNFKNLVEFRDTGKFDQLEIQPGRPPAFFELFNPLPGVSLVPL